jgi:hypothetical protein
MCARIPVWRVGLSAVRSQPAAKRLQALQAQGVPKINGKLKVRNPRPRSLTMQPETSDAKTVLSRYSVHSTGFVAGVTVPHSPAVQNRYSCAMPSKAPRVVSQPRVQCAGAGVGGCDG